MPLSEISFHIYTEIVFDHRVAFSSCAPDKYTGKPSYIQMWAVDVQFFVCDGFSIFTVSFRSSGISTSVRISTRNLLFLLWHFPCIYSRSVSYWHILLWQYSSFNFVFFFCWTAIFIVSSCTKVQGKRSLWVKCNVV